MAKKEKSPDSVIITVAVLGSIALMIGACSYFVVFSLDSMVVKPKQILTQTFVDLKPSDVNNLHGNGRQTGAFDVWIRFSTPKAVKLAHPEGFNRQSPLEAQRWFMLCLPDDPGLKHPSDEYTLDKKEMDNGGNVTVQWLLTEYKTNDYYYRYWGQ